MKKITTIIKWVLLILLALFIAILSYIYIHKDELIQDVIKELNKSSAVKVEFDHPDITFFSSFPNLGMQFEHIVVQSKADIEDKTIFTADKINAILDIGSIISKSEVDKITQLYIDKPILNLHQYKNSSNFDLESTTSSSNEEGPSSVFQMAIDKIKISNGAIMYVDHNSGFHSDVTAFNLDGDGTINGDIIDFTTDISTIIRKVKMGKIPLFDHTKFNFKGVISTDIEQMVFGIKNAFIHLNDLAITTNAQIKMQGEDIDIDADLHTQNESFKDFLSLIPSIYANDFEQLKTKGTADVDININGSYGEKSFPHIIVKNKIKDASIQYDGKTSSVNDIHMNMKLDVLNPSNYKVSIPMFQFNNNNQKFEGTLEYKDHNNNQHVDLLAKGIIDLALLHESIPMESIDHMSGLIDTDIKLKSDLKNIISKNYNNIDFIGFLKTDKIKIDAHEYPPLTISNLNMSMNPKEILLPSIKLQSNDDIISGNISIQDPLAWFADNQAIRIKGKLNANQINIDNWLPKTKTSKEAKSSNKPIPSAPLLYEFDINTSMDKVVYGGEQYLNNTFIAKGDQKSITIKSSHTTYKDNSIQLSGQLIDYLGYMDDSQNLKGDVYIQSKRLNINDFMETTKNSPSASKGSTTTAPPIIPSTIDLVVHGDIQELLYDDIVLKNLNGNIILKDQIMKFDQLSCLAFDGKMDFDGFYDTKIDEKPKFSIQYDNDKLSFSKTFAHIEILKKIMPIMKYVDGLLSTKLVFSGTLDKQMNIEPNSIVSDGFFETVNAKLNKFPITENISQKLGIEAFKNMKLVDSKNWFSIKDGTVEIKEFEQHVEDIDLKISGTHQIDQSINYLIKAHIPREMLKSNNLSNTVNTGINFLESEASKYGINIKTGSHIDLRINITGTLTQPKIKIVPTGTSGKSVQDVVKDKIKDEFNKKATEIKDSIQRAGNKAVEDAKEKARKKAKELEEEARKKLEAEKNKLIQKAKDEAKKKLEKELKDRALDSIENILKEKAKDAIPDKAKEEVDKLKDKINDWNPFKKKK